MGKLCYITHPEVTIDPAVPVPLWGLSDRGRLRVVKMLDQPWIGGLSRIIASGETKAQETAQQMAAHTGLAIEVRPGSGENDRSATGFVAADRYELLADRFFAKPEESVEGWERANDAQLRIVSELEDLLGSGDPHDDDLGDGDVAVIGHGGVGTLLYCHLTGYAIDRRWDQPGLGHYFTVDRSSSLVEHWWQPIDTIATAP